jgi:hypothetical protein
MATRYRVDGLGIDFGGGEIFRIRPARPWGPVSRVPFPGVKRPGLGVDHPSSSATEVKERVELPAGEQKYSCYFHVHNVSHILFSSSRWIFVYCARFQGDIGAALTHCAVDTKVWEELASSVGRVVL